MRYSIEPREQRYIQGYGFLFFTRNIGSHVGKAAASNVGDQLAKQGQEALKTAGKRALTNTAEATGDLVGQKIAAKITSKAQPQAKTQQELYIPPDKRQQIIDELKLIPRV